MSLLKLSNELLVKVCRFRRFFRRLVSLLVWLPAPCHYITITLQKTSTVKIFINSAGIIRRGDSYAILSLTSMHFSLFIMYDVETEYSEHPLGLNVT